MNIIEYILIWLQLINIDYIPGHALLSTDSVFEGAISLKPMWEAVPDMDVLILINIVQWRV